MWKWKADGVFVFVGGKVGRHKNHDSLERTTRGYRFIRQNEVEAVKIS
jgi:hypothetical protein